MIIISKHTNQLCNRLFTYLPIMSYALEANEPVCFLFQYKQYDSFFPNLKKEGIKSYWKENSRKNSYFSLLFNGIIRGINYFVHVVLMPGEKIPLHKPLGILFNPKWREVRHDKAFIKKHSEHLRYLFSPAKEVWESIDALWKEQSGEYITVGVHIRRGDYRTYKNGIWHFDFEVYKKFMLQLEAVFKDENKAVRFFVCSNEKIESSHFNGCNVIMQEGDDMIFDLYALSRCEYIIGPPSTYSQWASFYGKKPLAVLIDANSELSGKDFSIIETLNNDFYKKS